MQNLDERLGTRLHFLLLVECEGFPTAGSSTAMISFGCYSFSKYGGSYFKHWQNVSLLHNTHLTIK